MRNAAPERETLGYEVVVRFFPGAEVEAMEFSRSFDLPAMAKWLRVDRIVVPEGEEREQMRVVGRSGG